MALTKDQISDQLRKVNEPELHRDLVTLNLVKNIALCDGLVSVQIELSPSAGGFKDQLKSQINDAIRQLPEVTEVNVEFINPPQPSAQQKAATNNPLPGVKHIIAVGAGKGGVGKSTVSVNLAVGLALQGASVGLLDGDIYGPSAPTMLGLHDLELKGTSRQTMIPFAVHGIRAISMGSLVDDEKPLIWRGPMAHGAFRDLATRTEWGDLDYLIIDLPPGTGDVPLTMSQILPLAGAVVVCTPQKVAQDDARRAVRMFQQLDIPVLGLVENMSYFIGDDGKEYDIFGRGGAQQMAQEMGLPFLGMVPINMALRANSDEGTPLKNFEPGSKLANELNAVVRSFKAQMDVAAMGASGPSMSIR